MLIKGAVTRGFYLEQNPLIALIEDLRDTPERQNNNGGESKTREDGRQKKIGAHQPARWAAVQPANNGGSVVVS